MYLKDILAHIAQKKLEFLKLLLLSSDSFIYLISPQTAKQQYSPVFALDLLRKFN